MNITTLVAGLCVFVVCCFIAYAAIHARIEYARDCHNVDELNRGLNAAPVAHNTRDWR